VGQTILEYSTIVVRDHSTIENSQKDV